MPKTNDYSKFKFRKDNRDKIDFQHVKRLVNSIKEKNLLQFQPVLINADWEILDGQHRILAARELGVEVYYEQRNDLKPEDIIRINIAKAWTKDDYLNFYKQNGYSEYITLSEFCQNHALGVSVSLRILGKGSRKDGIEFQMGKFKFPREGNWEEKLIFCSETVEIIKKYNGKSSYHSSGKFWSALLSLIDTKGFEKNKWMESLKDRHHLMCAQVSEENYFKLMMSIYGLAEHR